MDELNVEDLLTDFAKSPEEINPEPAPEIDIDILRRRLEGWTRNCRDLLLDLRVMDFSADDEDMSLTAQEVAYYNRPLYFKADPQNPRDPKIILAQKQFCKFFGVPHSFFMKNRPTLKMNIVQTWQAGLNAEEDKAQCIARIRESEDHSIIRALIPADTTPLPNHELIEIIQNNVGDRFDIEFATGDERDDLILHARFLLKDEFTIGDRPVCLGFSLIASELGASPLVVEVLLHDKTSHTSYICTYGADSFFTSKYEGIQQSEVKELFPKLLSRVHDELEEIIVRVVSRAGETIDPRAECVVFNRIKGLNSKFKKAIFHEVSECEDDISNPWDFARHACLIAKDFDTKKRLGIERAAGKYLNLVFGKN